MLTKDDLNAILETIARVIKSENEATRKYLEEKIELSTRINAKIFKIELAETNKRIDTLTEAVKRGFENHETKITILENTVANKN